MRGSEILEQETPGPIGRGERLVTAGEDSRRRGARDDRVEVGLAAGTFVQARVEVVAARLEEDVRGASTDCPAYVRRRRPILEISVARDISTVTSDTASLSFRAPTRRRTSVMCSAVGTGNESIMARPRSLTYSRLSPARFASAA